MSEFQMSHTSQTATSTSNNFLNGTNIVFLEIRQCLSKSGKGKLRMECKIGRPDGLHRDSLEPICYQSSVRKPHAQPELSI